MNKLKSIGIKLAGGIAAMGLVSSAAFAGAVPSLTVNLPQPVTVGAAVLASGEYTITSFSMNDGSRLFVFRSDKGEAVSAVALKSADAAADQKTGVVLTNTEGTLHLDKMFIAGESAGYQFAVSK